jgi:superfamily II DNA helicase RecQ
LKSGTAKGATAKAVETDSEPLTVEGEALAARIREWRSAEAKKLGVPAYLVLHDRTIKALAGTRPVNPRQLLEVNGMGPAKVERFGEAILGLCTSVS